MTSLQGQFLVAMPDMSDQRFTESVIYMVAHSDEGAMGLMVNQPMPDMRFADILDELELGAEEERIKLPMAVRDRQVLSGGPVERGRGFVLHSGDYRRRGNSVPVTDAVYLTATHDILKAIAFGPSPSQSLFALGYCGWAPGQLENEMLANGWLNVPHSDEILFGLPLEARYDAALGALGVNRANLSAAAGSA